MSIFNIKLKTKSGNDVRKKETFTVLFRLNYKKGLKTTAEYTFRIMHSKGTKDTRVVMELKNPEKVKSLQDLTLKVILNFLHMISKITEEANVNPDFILFLSPDLDGKTNKAWRFLKDAFKGITTKVYDKDSKTDTFSTDAKFIDEPVDFASIWNDEVCAYYKVDLQDLLTLRGFVETNPNCHFMAIDPNLNPTKYAKSIHICEMLKDRIDRKTEITEY